VGGTAPPGVLAPTLMAAPSTDTGRRTRSLSGRGWLRLLVGLCIVGGVAWAWGTGALEGLDVERLRDLVAQAGPWGPVGYVLAFSALQPFGISAHVFLVVAGLAWSPGLAVLVGWLGMMGASAAAFGLARWIGRDAIQSRLPGWLEKWDARLAEEGLRAVILIRLLFFTTFTVQLMMGVSRVRFRDYLIGSAIGNLPVLVLIVLMADRIATWLSG
jgi:uncharacterized membrane protein YdjX (TVP38/TMEM64 family)